MARRPHISPLDGDKVPVVIATGMKIDGRDYRPNDPAVVPRALADDLKTMRQARDMTAEEQQRAGYLRRDITAG